MKKIVLIVILCFGFLVVQGCRDTKKESTTEIENEHDHSDLASADAFACPMGCEEGKTYESETICPVCNMVMKKVEDTESIDDQHKDHKNERHEHNHDSVHGDHE